MKKALHRLSVSAFLLLFAFCVPAESFAGARAEVRLAPIGRSFAPPRLGRNQGWLTITNRDWKPYTITVAGKGRMTIVQGAMPKGTVIRSGNSVTMAVDRDTWELRGASGDDLRCRVREGRTTTVSLEPFGFVNSTGLRGIVNDGDRVRDEVLFESGVPVVVQRPPVIVHRPPAVVHTPPPVVVTRPPVVVAPPPRRPTHRPPVHRPQPGMDREGWGFSFGFNSR